MSQPFIVSIPHHLGKDEAVRRLKAGLGAAEAKFHQFITVAEQTWTGDRLNFRVAALGQAASGTIDVLDDHVRLEIVLPWLLAQAAHRVSGIIKSQGTLLLDKK
jgi:hypothetical protein